MAPIKHGNNRRGQRTREYRSWVMAKNRCYNKHDPKYHYHGGRGIRMCVRWRQNFAAFLADMGPRPPKYTLDRINNDGDYEPGNCRWASHSVQTKNQRKRTLGMPWLDLTGQRFGRLRVVRLMPRTTAAWTAWECLCVCGKTTIVRGYNLRNGSTRSCGCLRRDVLIDRNKTEDHATFPRPSARRPYSR